MAVSGTGAPRASRAFVTTPYHTTTQGVVAVLPLQGPCSVAAAPCCVGMHHRRRRKTGPPWGWVAVLRCRTHALAFTVYPPGHVPHGRVPWVELAPGGGAVERGEESPPAATLFTAAEDAAQGERWPRDSAPSPPDAVRSTQRRRVARAALVLGLGHGSAKGAETVAAVTGLPAGWLVQTAQRLACAPDVPAQGRAVSTALAGIAELAGRSLMDRLAVLGCVAGLWGAPLRWGGPAACMRRLGSPFWKVPARGTTRPAPPQGPGADTHDLGPRGPP